MSNTIELALDGLSCGHCVKRVKESLEQRPDVERADVTIEHASVTTTAPADALIETVKQAGYDATLAHPKANPLTESSTPSEARQRRNLSFRQRISPTMTTADSCLSTA